MVSASDLQSGSPVFESRSGRLLDLFSVVQILSHACKQPTGCLLPVLVFNPGLLFELFVFSGVPIN